MKKIIYTLAAILFSTGIYAQNLVEALRYSAYRNTGTARSVAMGNAFGALGGDFSSLSTNPAGLGLYRSGEFVITPSIGKSNIEGLYLGNTASDSKYNVSLDNIGYVATINSNDGSGLVSLNFGVGYNRLKNFNQNMLAQGYDSEQSMLDNIVAKSNGVYKEDLYDENNPYDYFDLWDTKMAWETYLIDLQDGSGNQYTPHGLYTGDLVDQRKTTARRGYINEYLFSAAANFNHKLYIGATIGIHDLYSEESSIHSEFNVTPNFETADAFMDNFSYYQNLKTSGTGYNFKLGVIYKPINNLRLGLAIHTPTFYNLHDSYNYKIESEIETGSYSEESPYGKYDYDMETPLRALFSAAYVIGKKGLISVDYELVDYSTAKLRDGGDQNYQFIDENNDIAEAYKSVGNLHIGGEYRLTDNFSLRAGYEKYPSAFKSHAFGEIQQNSNANYSAVSAGLGIKQGSFFIDMAYKHSIDKEYNTLYDGSEFAKYDISNDNFILTLGFKF